MKTHFKTSFWLLFVFALAHELHPQGYIVPNGVTYAGWSFGAWEIDVVHNPTNYATTGFSLQPWGVTPPSPYTNTFRFGAILDVSVRVFFVSINDPVSLQAVLSHSYTELTYPNRYVLPSGVPFYVGLYTGNDNWYPYPDGIYQDPLFGWAELVNNQGVIQLLDGALAYKAQGIFAGTRNLVPEPSAFGFLALGGLLLGWQLRRRLAT